MTPTLPNETHRELWFTPAVRWFLANYGQTKNARRLMDDIVRALDGRGVKNGRILHTVSAFLLLIADPDAPGGYDRIVVWHAPSDGGDAFTDDILEKALPCGVDFV